MCPSGIERVTALTSMGQVRILRRFSPAVLSILLVLPCGTSAATLEERVDELRSRDPQKLGPAAIIQECEALIKEYPGDPSTAEVMMRIADMCEMSDPKGKIKPDPEAALRWYREAGATAVPGSTIWSHAQFRIAQRLRAKNPNSAAVAEARSTLELIARHASDHPLVMARVEAEFVSQCLIEGDYAGAERNCLALLKRKEEPAPTQPPVHLGEIPLKKLQTAGAHEYLLGLIYGPVSKGEKAQRINAVRQQFPWVERIDKSTATALKQLDILDERPPVAIAKPEAVESVAKTSNARSIFLKANIGAVILLTVGLVYKRVRNRVRP